MSKPRRIEFQADQKTIDFLAEERKKTGASTSEILRRAVAAAAATNHKPEQETR